MKEKEELPNYNDGVPDKATLQPEESKTEDKTPKSNLLIWMKKEQFPNRRETKTVPSKKWSEGQARTKTHYYQKSIRNTQQHGNTRKRKRSYHGKNTIIWY